MPLRGINPPLTTHDELDDVHAGDDDNGGGDDFGEPLDRLCDEKGFQRKKL